jgi:hypothetical protein
VPFGYFQGILGMIQDIIKRIFDGLIIDDIGKFQYSIQPTVSQTADVNDDFV